ncbi:hypothetical protein M6B38_185600 [Iris pallida]|uniref:Uncharacterized protein n=1 Tax=Iris pallida TaxID=29817 RepID=A0AAX6EJE3_IRIPA|nr:hypothetical protein M6B38_185600 [Iris pallida]
MARSRQSSSRRRAVSDLDTAGHFVVGVDSGVVMVKGPGTLVEPRQSERWRTAALGRGSVKSSSDREERERGIGDVTYQN